MNKKRTSILIVLLNLIVLIPIFLSTTKLGHDMFFHLSNIDVLKNGLSLESLLNGFNIRGEIANNLGYGIGIFYPILPHLIGALIYKLFSIFDLSIITTTYFIYLMISIISSLLIYNLALKLHKNNLLAILSSVIYITAPYFLGNIFVRFAFNEIFFFMFLLIMLNGLFYLKDNRKLFYIFFIMGYVGMITSHLVLSLFSSILFVLYLLINIKDLKKYIKQILIAIISVTILVLPNIILLLEHQLSNDYIFNANNIMTSLGLVTSEIVKVKDLIIPLENYDWISPIYIPVIIIGITIMSVIYIIKNHKKIVDKNILFLLISLILFLFMISSLFPWHLLPNILLMIQFPWRLEGILIIIVSLLAPFILLSLKNNKYFNRIIYLTIMLVLLIQIPLTMKLNNRIYNYSDYGHYTLNDAMGHQHEYLPITTIDNWDSRGETIISSDSNIKITILENNEILKFRVGNIDDKVKISLPKIYYKGYQLTDKDNNKYKLSNDLGYVGTIIDHDGEYTLKYVGTPLYIIFRIVKALSIITFITYFIVKYFKNK